MGEDKKIRNNNRIIYIFMETINYYIAGGKNGTRKNSWN